MRQINQRKALFPIDNQDSIDELFRCDSAWIRYPRGKDRFLIFCRRRGSTWVTHLNGRGDSEMVVVVVDKAPIFGHEAASKKHSAPCLEESQTGSIGDEEYSISTAYKEKDCRTTLTFAAAVRREQNAASHRFFFQSKQHLYSIEWSTFRRFGDSTEKFQS